MGMLNSLDSLFTKFSTYHWSRICHRQALLYFPQSTGRTSHHFNRTFQRATRRCPLIRTTCTYLGSSQPPIPPVYAFFALPWWDENFLVILYPAHKQLYYQAEYPEESKENDVVRPARGGREDTSGKKSCPEKKGPTDFVWENDDGVWTRTFLPRGQVEVYSGNYRSS